MNSSMPRGWSVKTKTKAVDLMDNIIPSRPLIYILLVMSDGLPWSVSTDIRNEEYVTKLI